MALTSDFRFLYQKQAEGEWMAVSSARVDALEAGGHIGAAEAEDFRLNGIIAAHLERNWGYTGIELSGIDLGLRTIEAQSNMVEVAA